MVKYRYYIIGSETMKDKIINFLKSPSLALILFLTAMLAVLWAYGSGKRNKHPGGDTRQKIATEMTTTVTTTSITSTATSKTTTSAMTTTAASFTTTSTFSTSTTTATQTTTATAPDDPDDYEPGQPLSSYLYAGVSPNSAFYQERMAIAGDSIATGFNIYGYIPYEHNIAKESVGLWNYGNYTFNFGYGDMAMIDAIAYMQPRLLYISMGMNDLPGCDPDLFADVYYDLILQILAVDPDVNIVAAGISPVCDYVTYSTNENIRNYNYALENMIYSIGSQQVYYFDAYSVLADRNTLALSSSYSAGDGIHLASYTYGDILTALFNFLDTTPVMENIMNAEQQ